MCQECGVGKYSSDSSIYCRKCSPGFVQSETGQGALRSDHKTQADSFPVMRSLYRLTFNFSFSFFLFYFFTETCEVCPKGWYEDAALVEICTACLAGRYMSSNTPANSRVYISQCHACWEVGKYADQEGSTGCKSCPKGWKVGYQDQRVSGPGNKLCTECPAGKFNTIEGSGECRRCDAGQFKKAATLCEKCPAGFYQLEDETSECKECEAGRWSDEEHGKEGSASMTEKTDSSNTNECWYCNLGKYNDDLPRKFSCTNGQLRADSSTGCETVTFTAVVPASCTNGQLLADSTGCETVAFTATNTDTSVTASCDNGGVLNTNSDGCEITTYVPFEPASCSNGGLMNADANGCLATVFIVPCKRCAEGQYASKTGLTTCTVCPVGYFGRDAFDTENNELSFCENCPSGWSLGVSGTVWNPSDAPDTVGAAKCSSITDAEAVDMCNGKGLSSVASATSCYGNPCT